MTVQSYPQITQIYKLKAQGYPQITQITQIKNVLSLRDIVFYFMSRGQVDR